ncbi:ABC transporter substrate-binding protein [Chitinimonas sp. BJYL2]|uniref:ABC transporter substrate-binding protein n=1 Tax=Chitinimonas sp. BJYL2 TaxID=2976696 RepID=UPI0022B58463|nr:ABC transporter substrate-binding protein [Chitinimonas sp. BJYL2]
MPQRHSCLFVFATCVTATSTLAVPLQALGPGEGRLKVIAWPGYLERGDSDKRYDWLSAFERDTGCKVSITTAATSDAMIALMNKGEHDLVTASGDASLRLILARKVQPLNLKLIPAYATVDPRLQKAPWHVVDGRHYGVPYQWGANFLAYNTRVFSSPPDSWRVVFEAQTFPDGKASKGRIQAYDAPIAIADAALYLMHQQPALGIRDPYELNEAQYAATLALLRAQKPLVQRYWHDVNQQINDFRRGSVVAASAWGFQINALKAQGVPVAGVIPREGATGWADTTMLHATARHPVCAYKWMEYSLNPVLQSALAEWFGSNPAVPSACDTPAPAGTRFCATNGFARMNQIRFWKTPQTRCATQTRCVPYSRWAQDYPAIMAGR